MCIHIHICICDVSEISIFYFIARFQLPPATGRPGTPVTCEDPSLLMPATTSAAFAARRRADGEDPVVWSLRLSSELLQVAGVAPVAELSLPCLIRHVIL